MRSKAVPDVVRRIAVWTATPSGFAAIFVAGLVIRLVLARGGGFPYDMASFKAWSIRLADRGPWDFYPTGGEEFFVDYPPGYLFVLWVVGSVAKLLGSDLTDAWLKIPPIAGDLGVAWLVSRLAVRITPPALMRHTPVRGLAAAAILLNPAVFFVSAVWGQADSVLALIVVGAFLLLGTGLPSFQREAGGLSLLAIAIGTKPQAAFVVPIAVLLLVWRHLVARAESATDELRPRAVRSGLGRIVSLGVVGTAAGFALLATFGLFPVQAFERYRLAARTYSVTSVFAFNLWGAVGFWRADVGAEAVRVLGVPALFWGIALFVVGASIVLAFAWRSLRNGEDEGRVLVFGGVAIALVGFAVLTRIHERYLFLPLALLAACVGLRRLRAIFVALSVLYLVNVYYPYIYYLDREGRPALLGDFLQPLYGDDITGPRPVALSLLTALFCVVVAWRGWRLLATGIASDDAVEPEPVSATIALAVDEAGVEPDVTTERPPPPPWSLRLHPVGRRLGLLALAIFAVAFGTRVAGLGHPPGMYFDEVYHARTGGEYLQNREVYEWTHPPFAKEVIAASIATLSGFRAGAGGTLPTGVPAPAVTTSGDRVMWAEPSGGRARLWSGEIDADCTFDQDSALATVDIRPDAVAHKDGRTFVAGVGEQGPALLLVQAGRETWRATLPDRAATVVAVGQRAYALTADGQLVSVSPTGDPETVAIGGTGLAASPEGDRAWASFGDQSRVASWDTEGERRAVVETAGPAGAIAVARDRAVVSLTDRLVVIDTESDTVQADSDIDGAADLLLTIPERDIVYAGDAQRIRAIEPRGASVIGEVNLDATPDAFIADPTRHRLVAADEDRLTCVSGRPQFAWRLPCAVMGAAMVALAFLLAIRLFGSLWVGLLAALFLTVDGLAYTLSRIAMNDSFATAFLLAAWFCVLSALYWWGRRTEEADDRRSRGATLAWLAAAGVCAGLGLASKWVALYAIGAIGLLVLWDGVSRGRDGLFGIAGPVPVSMFVVGVLLGVLPLAIYFASYLPYFSLGHSFGDVLALQRDMYNYHADLTATHPFGSSWFAWPIGGRAVFLYLDGSGGERAEMWTIPNLVVFWGGLLALGGLAYRAVRARSVVLGFAVFAAAVQYLPWTIISRVTFLYHYLPVVPFLCIALAWWLVLGFQGRKYRAAIAAGVSTFAVALFVVVLPMLVGWRMPESYLDAMRALLPWVLP